MVLASHSLESRILFFCSALFPLYITMVSTLVSVFRLCMTSSCQGKTYSIRTTALGTGNSIFAPQDVTICQNNYILG